MTRTKTRKRAGPLFKAPEPAMIPVQDLPGDEVARRFKELAQQFREPRDTLNEFLQRVLSYSAEGDRGQLLEPVQLHARQVKRGMGKAPHDADLAALVQAAVLLGQSYQQFWFDLRLRDLVRTGEAIHSNPTRVDDRDARIRQIYASQPAGQRMKGTLRRLNYGVSEKTVKRAVRKGRKPRRDT